MPGGRRNFGDGEIGKYTDVVAVDEDLSDFLVQADTADLLQVCVGASGSPTGP